jgi:Na+/H+ antiporter NhaB
MIKQFFKSLQAIVVVLAISVFGYSIYQKVQEKSSMINAKLLEANNLLDRMKRHKKMQLVGDAKRGYIMFDNSNSALYFKDLQDTTDISYLLQKVDSILVIQKFNYVKK